MQILSIILLFNDMGNVFKIIYEKRRIKNYTIFSVLEACFPSKKYMRLLFVRTPSFMIGRPGNWSHRPLVLSVHDCWVWDYSSQNPFGDKKLLGQALWVNHLFSQEKTLMVSDSQNSLCICTAEVSTQNSLCKSMNANAAQMNYLNSSSDSGFSDFQETGLPGLKLQTFFVCLFGFWTCVFFSLQ